MSKWRAVAPLLWLAHWLGRGEFTVAREMRGMVHLRGRKWLHAAALPIAYLTPYSVREHLHELLLA